MIDSERFAGAQITYTVEAMMQDGKALQFGTSHHLGQNFAKAFGLKYTDESNVEQFCWQTSWGVSTRMIGALIMTHSDDRGLVVPPRLASVQVIVIPLWFKDEQKESVLAKAEAVAADLKKAGIRVKVDKKEGRPGEKIFAWEKKGVPVRIEIGPKDIEAGKAVVARRDTGEKADVPFDQITSALPAMLEDIHESLFARAKAYREAKTVTVNTYEEFKAAIEGGNFVRAHWCGDADVEAKIKEETNATIRCIPFAEPEEAGTCVYSGKPSSTRVIFARAY